jgi:hypothetical protein
MVNETSCLCDKWLAAWQRSTPTTPPERTAYEKALLETAGSEAMAKTLNAENEKLVVNSMRFYTHTHP